MKETGNMSSRKCHKKRRPMSTFSGFGAVGIVTRLGIGGQCLHDSIDINKKIVVEEVDASNDYKRPDGATKAVQLEQIDGSQSKIKSKFVCVPKELLSIKRSQRKRLIKFLILIMRPRTK